MAEVLGPLGTATSLLSLIFATIPTIMKARQNYLECVDQLRRYKIRVSNCDARTEALLERCKGFNISQSNDRAWIVEDIERIRIKMHAELQTYGITDSELGNWRSRKVVPTRIREELLKRPGKYFRSTLYALYQRNIIEDWVTGMEKSIDCLEKLFQVEMESQTAGHFKVLDQDTVTEVEDLKRVMNGLSIVGRTLYKGTVASPATAAAHDWAIGLRSPEKFNDIENWRLAQVSIELSFSGSRSLKERIFWISICQDQIRSHHPLSRRQVEQAVLSQIGKTSTSVLPGVSCYPQDQGTRRTRPLGILFREKPDLFLDLAWKPNRASLIHGLLNTALLFWDTDWIKNMCSHGLRIEVGPQPRKYMQVLSAKPCSVDKCGKSDLRLRTLGLVLAEIVLTIPLRQRDATPNDHEQLQYQQLKSGEWRDISPMAIAREVRSKTKSIQYANAVSFCLTDMSKLAIGKFEPGYTFRCIEKIYKP
jgi:hypothetical protein